MPLSIADADMRDYHHLPPREQLTTTLVEKVAKAMSECATDYQRKRGTISPDATTWSPTQPSPSFTTLAQVAIDTIANNPIDKA